jgi:hypothetical protein
MMIQFMSQSSKRQCIVAILIGIVMEAVVVAEPAQKGLYLDQNVQAGYNPLGLQLGTKLFYRQPLFDKEGILWESAKVEFGVKNGLSPAFDFFGAFIDIEPIAVFDLALSAELSGYFDSLGFGFHGLPGYEAGYDAKALESLPAKNAGGLLLTAAPTLKFALGPFAFSNTLHVNYFKVDGGAGYFYEAFANCALKKSGAELYNDAYALYMFGSGCMAGLNDSILFVPGSGYRSHCIQAVGVINRALSDRLSFYAALTAGAYLEDRYYEYEPRVAGQAGLAFRL